MINFWLDDDHAQCLRAATRLFFITFFNFQARRKEISLQSHINFKSVFFLFCLLLIKPTAAEILISFVDQLPTPRRKNAYHSEKLNNDKLLNVEFFFCVIKKETRRHEDCENIKQTPHPERLFICIRICAAIVQIRWKFN